MNRNTNDTQAMNGQIDRLVTGELTDEQRRAVMEWCNEDPIRWRQCALAFLEAQTWQQGLASWTMEGNSSIPATTSVELNPKPSTRPPTNWKVLVASIAIAFFLGVLVRDPQLFPRKEQQPTTTARPILPANTHQESPDIQAVAKVSPNYVTVPVRTSLSPNVISTLRIPVDLAEKPAMPAAQPDVPDYVKRQWEKRGYQIANTERFLSAHLPDGRDVVVPVSGVEVKYVGRPVY